MQDKNEYLYVTLLEGSHKKLDQVYDKCLIYWLEDEKVKEAIHYVLYSRTSLFSFVLWHSEIIDIVALSEQCVVLLKKFEELSEDLSKENISKDSLERTDQCAVYRKQLSDLLLMCDGHLKENLGVGISELDWVFEIRLALLCKQVEHWLNVSFTDFIEYLSYSFFDLRTFFQESNLGALLLFFIFQIFDGLCFTLNRNFFLAIFFI